MTETLRIDRRFPGVGRIVRASGTTKPQVLRKINRTLTALYDDGRLDLLLAIRDGELTAMQVYDLYTRKALHTLPVGAAAKPLSETWTAWVADKECSAEHKRSLGKALKYLAPAPRATVSDVPALLEAARVTLKGKPQTFRLLRAGAQAFVKAQVKRSHALYAAVSDVEPMKPSPKKLKHPATVKELRAIMARMSAPLASIAWSLALTGMRPNEYWGNWSMDTDGIKVWGTKTRGAVRHIPCATIVTWPRRSYTVFRKALNKASDSQMSVYDLRRTYANWLEAASVPRTRRKLYMGHGNEDVTSLYEWHEVQAFLAEDAAKLRAFVGETTQGLRIAK